MFQCHAASWKSRKHQSSLSCRSERHNQRHIHQYYCQLQADSRNWSKQLQRYLVELASTYCRLRRITLITSHVTLALIRLPAYSNFPYAPCQHEIRFQLRPRTSLKLGQQLLCRSRLNLHITVQMRHAGRFKLFSTPAPLMSTDPQMACTIRIGHLNLFNASRMHANISNGRLCTSDPLQCLSRCLCSHSLETNPYGTCSCFRIENASAGLAPKLFLPIILRLQ